MSDDLEAATHLLQSAIPITGVMGIRVVEAEPGRAATEVDLDGNANHIGTMYAGVLFSVAEVLGAIIARRTFDMERHYPIVKDLRIDFRRPARTRVRASGALDAATVDRVRVEAEERGKADYVLETQVVDEDGIVVATTSGTYQIRRLDL